MKGDARWIYRSQNKIIFKESEGDLKMGKGGYERRQVKGRMGTMDGATEGKGNM